MRNVALIGVLAVALAGCATAPADEAAFDPAACYARDVDVYFDGFDATLSSSARGVIDVFAGQLRGCQIDQVNVIGFAGVRGPEDVNETVSAERAREIADYLVERHRWPRERIETLATGERGAVTDEGATPMRRRGRILVQASAPQ